MKEKIIWTLAEWGEHSLAPVSYEMLNRALELKKKMQSAKIVSLLLSEEKDKKEIKKLNEYGADEILWVRDSRLEEKNIENEVSIIIDLLKEQKPEIFLAGATAYGRTLLPYLAGKVMTGLTADCTILDIDSETGDLLQTRPAIGGNILATIKCPSHRPQMATIRPHSTALPPRNTEAKESIVMIEPKDEHFHSRVSFLGKEKNDEKEISISDAERIVVAGKGMGKEENIKHAEELADLLNAAVGATREAVDRGWMSYPHQVGLSGKTVNPKLCFSIGASGSIQHLAGMQTSEHIIAINKDPEAQIFKVANLGIVADWADILPPLREKIRKEMNS